MNIAFTAVAIGALTVLTACQKPAEVDDGFGIASVAAPAVPFEVALAASASARPVEPPPTAKVALIPEAFRGHWDANEDACLTGNDAPLRITEGSLDAWEDSSTARSIETLGPTHIRIRTSDYGEETSDMKPGDTTYIGESTWDLALLDNGATLEQTTQDGQVIIRIRCKDQ